VLLQMHLPLVLLLEINFYLPLIEGPRLIRSNKVLLSSTFYSTYVTICNE